MARSLETDSLSNQNITSALEIGSRTADATRLLFIRVLVDQVAGNGDYTVYATLQVNGAGSAYRLIPITTAAAASGITAIGMVSIAIPVDAGDIVKVYLLGLAGDTTTPDTRVDFYENNYLVPTTADRTLDVSSGGEAGVDWANVGSPTTTLNLSGTTVKTATDVETDTADIQTNVNAILADTGTDGVVVAAASKTGYALSSAGVQAIWDALTSALTTVGSVGKLLADNLNATVSSRSSHAAADIWAVATRLLTAGTNIVLAKGTGVTGFNDLDAAGVRSAVGMASADLDTQLDAILAASGGSAPTASAVADAVWDELLSGHVVSGSAGVALSNAGAHAGGGAVLTSFTVNDQAGHPRGGGR